MNFFQVTGLGSVAIGAIIGVADRIAFFSRGVKDLDITLWGALPLIVIGIFLYGGGHVLRDKK